MIARYLLDTNHFSGLWREQTPLVTRLTTQPTAHFAVSLPSVGELWFMVFHSARVRVNRRRLSTLLEDFELLDFDRSAAMEFGRIKAELSPRGTVLPDVDLQIAAIARSQGLVLLTADVSGLMSEDWSVSPRDRL